MSCECADNPVRVLDARVEDLRRQLSLMTEIAESARARAEKAEARAEKAEARAHLLGNCYENARISEERADAAEARAEKAEGERDFWRNSWTEREQQVNALIASVETLKGYLASAEARVAVLEGALREVRGACSPPSSGQDDVIRSIIDAALSPAPPSSAPSAEDADLRGLLAEAAEWLGDVHEGTCPQHWANVHVAQVRGKVQPADCNCGVEAWRTRARAALGKEAADV